MYLFDLNCDTITRLNDGVRLEPNDRDLFLNGAQLALDRMRGESWCQCFAIFIPDEYRGRDAVEYYERSYRYF
jgi:membrane dipeptidase